MPTLDLRDITKRFGQTVALSGINLSLKEGEVHALIGENGAGKSTLMNIISGGVRQDRGSMLLRGGPYSPADPLDARKNGIALIHQELSLAPHLSVAENIMMGVEDSRFGWFDRKEIERRADRLLGNFEHSNVRADALVGKLSPAEQQLVEICRALAANAKIVLMDEPTSSLQRDDVNHLFSLIRKLSMEGISIIYISHFLEEVREIADSFTVLRDGKSVSTGKITDVTDSFLISQMVGRSVDNLYPKRAPYKGKPETLLDVNNLALPPALHSATLKLERGEIFGIAGLMGAGRTEMTRALFGIDKPESGTVTVKGKVMMASGGKPALRLLQGVGYLSEDRKGEGLALKLSIADNITITRYGACSRFGWLDQAKQRSLSSDLMQTLDVRAKSSEQPVQTLSGGNQQKVAIARLLHQEADILLLDEPTRGIDIGSKAIIYETIAELAGQGKAIMLISSYLPELFGMCDRLAVMTRGRLSTARAIREWTPELVLESAINSDANNTNGH